MTNGTLLFPWLNSLEERQWKTLSKDGVAQGEESTDQSKVTWLHCSVGPVMEIGETDDVDSVQVCYHPVYLLTILSTSL